MEPGQYFEVGKHDDLHVMIENLKFGEGSGPKIIQQGNEIFCQASPALSVLCYSLSLSDK